MNVYRLTWEAMAECVMNELKEMQPWKSAPWLHVKEPGSVLGSRRVSMAED